MREVIDLERELTEAGILDSPLTKSSNRICQHALQLVAKSHGVTVARILGPGRRKTIARARRDAYAALRNIGLSLTEIGIYVGGRDPSTVLWGLNKRKRELAEFNSTPKLVQSSNSKAG